MIFTDTQDYLCYVEAVHLLYHENIKKECNFRADTRVFKQGINEHNITTTKLLFKDQRVKEYFYVLDNTEYSAALENPDWTRAEERPSDGSKDVNIELSFTLTYTSNNKYFAWTFVFLVVLIILGVILVASTGAYLRMSLKYKGYAKERKEMK